MLRLLDPKILHLKSSEAYFENTDWIIEPKLSGCRLQAAVHNDVVHYGGRQGTIDHSWEDKLSHITHSIRSMEIPSGTLLDGELHLPGHHYMASKIMHANADDALRIQESSGHLIFTVFDLLRHNNRDILDATWIDRRSILKDIMRPNLGSHVCLIEEPIVSKEGKLRLWESAPKMNLEGVVFKFKFGEYEQGRSKLWRKLKHSSSYDGVILGFNGVSESNLRMIPSMSVGQYREGKLTHVANIGGITNDEARSMMSMNLEKLIGSVVQFRADSRTRSSYKNPRFECLRPDKDATLCSWEARDG